MVGNLRLLKISCVLVFIIDASPAASFVAPSISSRGTSQRYHGYSYSSLQKKNKLARDDDGNRAKCIHHTHHQHYKRTHLASVSASAASSTIAAGSTLVVSSLLGMLFEKNICTAGHVVTLLLAALLSNTSQAISRMRNISSIILIPTDHFLYDWCWSIFLPASLVFALLSSSSSASSPETSATDATVKVDDASPTTTASKSSAMKSTILGMGLPFIAGSIGSILGCIAAFYAVAIPYTKEATALLTGCLCASYIGGTVNFFATAKIFKDVAGGDSIMGSAFGSMAAADLVVMAFYFAMLTAASKSVWLHRLFPSKCRNNYEVGETSNTNDEMNMEQSTISESTNKESKWSTFTATIIGSSVALTSVNIATRLENIVNNSFPPPFNIPGTLCAFLAMIGLAFERLIRLVLTSFAQNKTTPIQSTTALHIANSFRKISDISPKMSDICFYLLFASVGATADLASAVAGGPMALVFASLALMVHSITVVLATSTCMCLGAFIKSKLSVLKTSQWPSSSWEEVLTASNAAIGGPSTAAAFAAGLVPKDGETKNGRSIDRSQYRSALVIGATVWGVFGYAIATGIGVLLSRFLMK